MIYCQDCRFFAPDAAGKQFGRCGAAGARSVNNDRFIAPEFATNPFATTMRISPLNCGEDAKWFEPKQTESVAA